MPQPNYLYAKRPGKSQSTPQTNYMYTKRSGIHRPRCDQITVSAKNSRAKKNCGQKKTRGFSETVQWLQFLPKTVKHCIMKLCYIYFKNNNFGFFPISRKRFTNIANLVKNEVLKICVTYLIK